MTKTNRFALSLSSGILLGLGWPMYGFSPLLFIALFPLLQLEHNFACNQEKYKLNSIFGYSYLTFFTWNIISTWWVYGASLGGAAMAIFANALLMSITFTLAQAVKRIVFKTELQNEGKTALKHFVPFLLFWISFEFLHLDWDLTYPWLTLGNGLSGNPTWIQWYEYTGVFGGTLWILLINVLLFIYIRNREYERKLKSKLAFTIPALLIVPLFFSFLLYSIHQSKTGDKILQPQKIKVVAVQPNIDPYNEKFTTSFQDQLEKMLKLGSEKLDSTIDYLVFPETALTEEIWEKGMEKTESIIRLQEFLKKYPKLVLITGASTSRFYEKNEKRSATAQKARDVEAYYDNFNTAIQLDSTNRIQIYHKSKLVPGVERMPFPALLKPFEKLAINMGGTIGSLGTQEERTVFASVSNVRIAPVICYESIYGEFVSEYVKNGAQAIFIITNDGWWGDTPGYKQHLAYGSMRAIETRRCIVRSANTGISCFINERGDIEQATNWWQPAVIEAAVPLGTDLTFYTQYGDYIARFSLYTSLLLVVYSILIRFRILKKQ